MQNKNRTTPKAAPAADSVSAASAAAGEAHVTAFAAFRRRDATGHLDPAYAAGLRAVERETEPTESPNPDAFLHGMSSADPLAEEMGESFVRGALSGEDDGEDDAAVTEEFGGPFVVTTGETEFAGGTDPSNPPSATREPFPKS
jgi:hypothetical protein